MLQKNPRHPRIVRYSRRAVDRAFKSGIRLMLVGKESRIRICAGLEKKFGGAGKSVRVVLLKPEESREAKMSKSVPDVRSAFAIHTFKIGRNESRSFG